MVPCRHEGKGHTVQLTVESKLAHEQLCDWTPKACPYRNGEDQCPEMVDADTIVSHLDDAHRCEVIVGDQLKIERSKDTGKAVDVATKRSLV